MNEGRQPLMRYDQLLAIQACVKQACQTDCLMRAAAGQWSEDFCAATAPALDGGAPTAADGGADASAHGDGGSADGGGGSGGGSDAGATPPPTSGCGCDVTPAAPFRGAPPIAVLLLVAGLRRRTRAQPGNRR